MVKANFPLLFKGVAPDTHWHSRDPVQPGTMRAPRGGWGFTAGGLLGPPSVANVCAHITGGSSQSPMLSVTTSYAVAHAYAVNGKNGPATQNDPGFVYMIDLNELAQRGMQVPHITNPVALLAGAANGQGMSHGHTGDQRFVVDLANGTNPFPSVRWFSNTPSAAPSFVRELQALVYAIRDAELLITGMIPMAAIVRVDAAY